MKSLRLILTYLLLIACTEHQIEVPHSFRIYDENGIEIAETTGGPKYAGEIFEYLEVLRLNQDDSQEASLLARPYMYMMDEYGAF